MAGPSNLRRSIDVGPISVRLAREALDTARVVRFCRLHALERHPSHRYLNLCMAVIAWRILVAVVTRGIGTVDFMHASADSVIRVNEVGTVTL